MTACGGRVDGSSSSPSAGRGAEASPSPPEATAPGAPQTPTDDAPPPLARRLRGVVAVSSAVDATGGVDVHANFFAPVTVTETWGCREPVLIDPAKAPPSADAGDITVTFDAPTSLLPAVATRHPASGLYFVDTPLESGSARAEGIDAPFTVGAAGGADVPAFRATARTAFANRIRGLEDGGLLRDADLTLTWTEDRNDAVDILLWNGQTFRSCAAPGSAKKLVVPRDVVAAIRAPGKKDFGDSRSVVLSARRQALVEVDGAGVLVSSSETSSFLVTVK